MIIDWKEYFDNDCKGEDMWGHYKTANGSIYVVADGASNHDGSKTGADVVQLIHERLRKESPQLAHSSELRDLVHSINEESSRCNEGAYAAIAGVLHRGENLYAFGAGDVSVIAKKANGKLLQVLPLDLNMQPEEAEERARAEIGQTVNNIHITEENYIQRIKQYMQHGLSNAVGLGEDFVLHYKYFDAKADTAMLIASDGITDPFMDTRNTAGNIPRNEAEKLYELFDESGDAEASVSALESMIWNTRVMEKKKIKPDDRAALFLFINPDNGAHSEGKNINTMSNKQLAELLVRKMERYRMGSLDTEVTVPVPDMEHITDIAKELSRKLNKKG